MANPRVNMASPRVSSSRDSTDSSLEVNSTASPSKVANTVNREPTDNSRARELMASHSRARALTGSHPSNKANMANSLSRARTEPVLVPLVQEVPLAADSTRKLFFSF